MKNKLLFLIVLMMPDIYGCTKAKPEWNQALQQEGSYLAKYAQNTSQEELDLLKSIFDADSHRVKEIIVKEEIDVNSLADGRTTFLHAAADLGTFEGNDKDEMVSVMIEGGADINKVDEDGQTPLTFSTRIRNTPFGKSMVKQGANCRIADLTGKTVLHYATNSACPWRWELVEKLLPEEPKRDAIVDINVTDHDDMTALGYAIENVKGPDRETIIKRLRSKGATIGSF